MSNWWDRIAGTRRHPSVPAAHAVAEHEGRVPQVGVPSGPRQTVPALPSSPAASRPVYSPRTRTYQRPATSTVPTLTQQLSDLITPGPTAHETAEAAQRLGVKPKEGVGALAGGLGAAAASLAHAASQGANEISQDVRKIPKQRISSDLGRKTLGTPTAGQVFDSVIHGQARVNKGGKLTVPATRQASQKLVAAKRRVANTTGVTGPLTPGQKTFVQHYAKLTGLDPRVVAAQALAEESGSAAQQREAEGNHNWLNIGYFDSGPGAITKQGVWSTPESAAKASAEFTKGNWGGASSGIQHILTSDNASPQRQINAIGNSGWATSAYGDALRRTFPEVGVKSNPKALARLQAAKGAAQKLGIPTQAGDVEKGPAPKTVFVRADARGMVQWAQALLGTQEGSRLQLKWAAQSGVSAAEPWCSEFIAAGMQRRGLPAPEDPAYSGTWLDWKGGQNIGTNLGQAKPGDILVFGPTAHTAHVGLYIGNGQMISGNYGNEVAQAPVSQETASEPIAGIVRPHYKGGKVAVKESAVLPGAAIGPSGELVSGPAGVASGEAASGKTAKVGGAAPLYTASGGLSPLLATPSLNPLEASGLNPEEANELVTSILKRKRL